MTLAIDAKLQTQDGPVTVLTITGALGGLPVGAATYESDFASTLDGWAAGADSGSAGTVFRSATLPVTSMVLSDFSSHFQYAGKTITGLTIGHFYKITAKAKAFAGSMVAYATVVGISSGGTVVVDDTAYRTITYTFQATATSHVIQLRRTDVATPSSAWVNTIKVQEVTSLESGLTVQRTDLNGIRYVRQATDAHPDSAGALTILDEEFSMNLGLDSSSPTYVVRDAAGNLATDELTNADDAGTFAYTANVLTPVGYLGHAVEVGAVQTYDESYSFAESQAEALNVIGRGDPIPVLRDDDAWSLRSGTMLLFVTSYEAAQAIVTAYKVGRVSLLRFPTPVPRDLYHVPRTVKLEHVIQHPSGWDWTLTVDYVEVGPPSGDLQGTADWTFDDVLDTFLAFYNLPVAFGTFADLLAGP